MQKITAIMVISLILFGLVSVRTCGSDNHCGSRANGITFYVGGAGEGNYSSIQDAIDNASTGDTVFVYNGTYYENVIINKTINLIGESKKNTVIDGGGGGNVIYMSADWVNITNFTIVNSGYGIVSPYAGINFHSASSDNIILNCNISDNWYGVWLRGGDRNSIIDCTISNSSDGILFEKYTYSKNNNIINCSISRCGAGISFEHSSDNNVINCNISNNWWGIYFDSSSSTITNNTLNNNTYGLIIPYNSKATIPKMYGNFVNGINFDGTVIPDEKMYYYNEQDIVIENRICDSGHSNGYTGTITQQGLITLYDCKNVTINNNVLSNTNGIHLAHSQNITIIRCDIFNSDTGIYLKHSSRNSVTNCNLSNCEYGISVTEQSNTNLILNCSIFGGERGIYTSYSSCRNNITYCTVQSSGHSGITFGWSANENIISYSNILNNSWGIEIHSSSNDNWIHHNNIINNTDYQAYDRCSNYWDDGYIGNYWSDYNGSDEDSNGIGDAPYNISGGDNRDIYPLVDPWGVANHPPTLSNGTIFPISSEPTATFTYIITYMDLDNDVPVYAKVIIDNIPYNMTKHDITDENYVDGCVYNYSTTLSSGNHTYYFEFSDGANIVKLPLSGVNSGPTATEEDGGEDSEEDKDDSKKEEALEIKPTYVIIMVCIVAGAIIICAILLRKRKVVAPEIKKPKLEKPIIETPTITIRCPICKTTFTVEKQERPFRIRCPSCGKEGIMK